MAESYSRPYTLIKPSSGWRLINFKELKEYKDLFYFLVIRDIKVKYKQTVLGIMWAVIQPFFTMIVFSLFFGRLAKVPSDNIPYPIFSYAALVPWTYFANSMRFSSESLIGNHNLITKIYFPRLIMPIAPVLAGLLDFIISLSVLIIMMFCYRMAPTPYIVVFPILTLLMMMTASGVGMWLAALNTHYRDIKYTVPFLVEFWMFASPIAYPASMISERYRIWYGINPMAGIIEGFRSILLGTIPFPFKMLTISCIVSVLIFISGAFYFRRMERHFADVI